MKIWPQIFISYFRLRDINRSKFSVSYSKFMIYIGFHYNLWHTFCAIQSSIKRYAALTINLNILLLCEAGFFGFDIFTIFRSINIYGWNVIKSRKFNFRGRISRYKNPTVSFRKELKKVKETENYWIDLSFSIRSEPGRHFYFIKYDNFVKVQIYDLWIGNSYNTSATECILNNDSKLE